MFSLNNIIDKILNTDDNNQYMDSCENQILHYIKEIESIINNYGYKKIISSIDDISNLSYIEFILNDFFNQSNTKLDYLEILGTLKGFSNRLIYVCCYEPYGGEVFCIEVKDNNIIFFNSNKYLKNIKRSDIEYFNISFNK